MCLITGGAKEAPELVAEAAAAIRRSMINLDPAALIAASGEVGVGRAGERHRRLAANRGGGALRAKAQPGSAVRGAIANGRRRPTNRDVSGEAINQAQANMPASVLAPLAAEVAAVAGADGAAAARREALFERLHRQRAEAMLATTRSERALF